MMPQILANSGIASGEGVIVNLPGVGQNLQDHPVVDMAFRLSPEIQQQAGLIDELAEEMQE
jgi:choline dehydrogenase-like flavoprotein